MILIRLMEKNKRPVKTGGFLINQSKSEKGQTDLCSHFTFYVFLTL